MSAGRCECQLFIPIVHLSNSNFMRKIFSYLAATLLLSAMFSSCAKDNQEASQQVVSNEVLAKIAALGFSTEGVQVIEEGYLVENDIILHEHDLEDAKVVNNLIVAETEQYSTTNLVTGLPRSINITTQGNVNANVSNAIDAAITRYNNENLQLSFTRNPADPSDIKIRIVNGGGYIASAGFPSGGNPYNEVKFNRAYQNYSLGFVTTVIAHEIGHCIGFRHTDYMNRAYSCGSGGNEGDGGVGANHTRVLLLGLMPLLGCWPV